MCCTLSAVVKHRRLRIFNPLRFSFYNILHNQDEKSHLVLNRCLSLDLIFRPTFNSRVISLNLCHICIKWKYLPAEENSGYRCDIRAAGSTLKNCIKRFRVSGFKNRVYYTETWTHRCLSVPFNICCFAMWRRRLTAIWQKWQHRLGNQKEPQRKSFLKTETVWSIHEARRADESCRSDRAFLCSLLEQ